MHRIFVPAALLLIASACGKPKPDFTVKVLVGGTVITASDAAPIEDSIVVVAKGKIRNVGPRKDIPVPQASDRTDLAGEWIVPAEGARIEPGEPANLIVLKHAPNGLKPADPADVGARLEAGEWKMPGK
jgi:cytosine/adenosine deaminase-related metal-dependent hydrolase